MDLVTLILFLLGLVLLLVGAEFLVRGASRLAITWGISPLVVGLTVVAYGTSAPELAVTAMAAFETPPKPDIAVGNVVGSNLANLALVLGFAAIVTPLKVAHSIAWRSGPIMLAISVAMMFAARDGTIDRFEASLLVVGAILYSAFAIYTGRRDREIRQMTAEELEELPPVRTAWGMAIQALWVVVGLALLVIGSNWLVDGAVMFAMSLGVEELVIGLTVVAVGTSLPEAATSAMAAFKGETDIAVGNVVGSNIFNLLLVLGGTGLISPVLVEVSHDAFWIDLPAMLGITVATLLIFFTGYRVARIEGCVLFSFFIIYTVYRYLLGSGSAVAGTFGLVILYGVAPLALIVLLSAAAWQVKRDGWT